MGCNQSKDLDNAYNVGPGTLHFLNSMCLLVLINDASGADDTAAGETKETEKPHEEKIVKALRAKRGVIMAETFDMNEPYVKQTFDKSNAARELINGSLMENFFLFRELPAELQEEMVDSMEQKQFASGHEIITQGENTAMFLTLPNLCT